MEFEKKDVEKLIFLLSVYCEMFLKKKLNIIESKG